MSLLYSRCTYHVNSPFSLTGTPLAGQEQAVITDVVSQVQHTFAGTGIIFTTSRPFAGTEYSTVYVGGDDSAFSNYGSFLGLAERVDVGDQFARDYAFVFSADLTMRSRTVEGVSTALFGVVAHEIGHLLGYVHEQQRESGGVLSAVAQTVEGIISTDTVWNGSGSPYVVTGTVGVAAGVTLTIKPGVQVRLKADKGIQVDGQLVAIGTPTQPILFTSDRADPAPGDWAFLNFTDSSVGATFDGSGTYVRGSILQYCQVLYGGGSGVSGAVQATSAAPFVDHCEIGYSTAAGVYATDAVDLRISNSAIHDNTTSIVKGAGLSLQGGTVTITGNTIRNNHSSTQDGSGGIYASSDVVVVSNNVVTDNTGDGLYGGIGVYNLPGRTVTIRGNLVTGNRGGRGTGGIGVEGEGGTTVVSDNTVLDNMVGSGYAPAGGVTAWGTTVTFENNMVSNNQAGEGGS